MDLCKNGELICTLRKSKGMTQKQVAEKLGVMPKTVSKWETGHGFPDTSLLSELADILGVSIDTLLAGNMTTNEEEVGNFKRVKFYVCPQCGSFMHGIGECTISCCGKQLHPLKACCPNDEHGISVEETENEYIVTFAHEMIREHFIAFVSYVSNDRVMTVKLCPEQDSSVRFPKFNGGRFYFYCNDHGLFEYEICFEASTSGSNISLTALMSAFSRAYVNKHSNFNLFCDDYAEKMLSEEEYNQLESFISAEYSNVKEYVYTNLAPTPLARSRFCEDALKTAVKTGTRQYVILGCGFDTFSFRNTDKNIRIFEIDKAAIISDKLKRINRAGLTPPENVQYIAADLSNESLASVLGKNGFDRNKKTFFSCLGLLYYLTNDEISELFESIAEISPDGSTVAFDFPDSHLFSSSVQRVKNMLAMAEKSGEPMKSCFGYGELEKMLDAHSFLLYEFLNRDEIQDRFFNGYGSEMTAFENINYAQAVLFNRHR
ncbi:MAG: SAM-dependent methyltransferase [Oscillospiraceae bacterium]